MTTAERQLLSGDDAVALAALHAGVRLGTGYPGTPSTEILETFDRLGGHAQWSPNEKVALEVALGVAFAGARTLVTMKHVGLNVAADPLFTATYTDVEGGLVIVSADDPGMASSQNEQDNRHYSRAAAIPTLEPVDSQQAYDFTLLAFEISERWKIPVLLRITTRVCHSKTIVIPRAPVSGVAEPAFERKIPARVMIPAYAKPAHHRLRTKLAEIAAWNEAEGPIRMDACDCKLGVVATGISAVHAREAAPDASHLTIGMTYPLPIERIRAFAAGVERLVVVEEGDPVLTDEPAPPASRPKANRRCIASASWTWRVCAASWPATPARSPSRPRASHREPVRAAPTGRSSRRSETSIASSRAISAATPSACCRPSRRWIPVSAWAPVSAWGSACGMYCPTRRRAAWSA